MPACLHYCYNKSGPGSDQGALSAKDWKQVIADAARHAVRNRPFRRVHQVDRFHSGRRTALSVADEGGPTEPVVAEAGEWDESGRGLRTVALLADSWGWHGGDTGRTVTAVFAAEPSG